MRSHPKKSPRWINGPQARAQAHFQLSDTDDMFKRWLKEATLRGYRCADGIATYAVTVSSVQAKDMLQRRYYRNVERVFKGLQNTPVKIEFETDR